MNGAATPEYDVIVVGSGSSGGALAGRLSEDGGRSVLVLEAGPAAYGKPEELPQSVLDPADFSNALPGAPFNWDLFGLLTDDFRAPVSRGKGLGGSSSINGAYFIRGLPENFAEWAALGNDEWSYDKVLPFFRRLESDRDHPDGELHGDAGPIPIHRESMDRAPEFTEAFTKACVELGHPEEPDKNAPAGGGVGPVPMNVDRGRRVGTALGYLLPALSRPNLEIRGGALVRRVLLDAGRCVGVEADVGGERRTFRAGEVVISAGALRTPQILMLSGIGPADHLREVGIEVEVPSEGVGKGLADHPELNVPWTLDAMPGPMPGRGVLTSALHCTAEGSDKVGDLEILPFVASPATMMHLAGLWKRPVSTLKMMAKSSPRLVMNQARAARLPFIVIGLQQEQSRGSVTLASADPTAAPALRWNLFAAADDRRRFREAVRVTHEIFQTSAMRSAGGTLVGLDASHLADDASTDAWVRTHIFTAAHPSCTCRMGPDGDPGAVVDQFGRVRGVENLRVCDQSAFPTIPSRGPNATAVMLGERMSEFFS